MNNLICKLTFSGITRVIYRNLSATSVNNKNYSCKLLVIGGGSGGCTIAAKFARRLKKDSVIIIEPSINHYYQPLFTLVGAGITKVATTRRHAVTVLPQGALWLKDTATQISPSANKVQTADGDIINYEYLVIAVGLNNDFCKVPGLSEALEDKNSSVSTIYSANYCEKTYSDMQNLQGGDAIFTYPDTPIKCPGAPQKILYLADSFLTKMNRRSKVNLMYNTFLPVIFGVKKYADSLMEVVKRKNISVNYTTVLREVRHDRREAVFYSKNDDKETTMQYAMLHVSPPMVTPDLLKNNKELTDKDGFLQVDKYTLQQVKYPNIYGIGDCTNTPNSKTGAAVAKQSYVLEMNLLSTMKKDSPKERYNGYGACPLVTSYNTCILAEFLYDGVVWETFPYDQSKESVLAFYMKKDLFPFIYWNFMLKGYYHGPEFVRKIINPFGK